MEANAFTAATVSEQVLARLVHVFDAETRSYYGLDDLWADAKHVGWERE